MGFFGNNSKAELIEKDAEIKKLMQIVDNVDNIVMLCDATSENKIFYMNSRAKDLLQRFRSELNAGLRGADVSNAINNSIHQFHKDPGRVKRFFANPRTDLPHTAEIPIGSITLKTTAYPIWDGMDSNRVLCYMACWSDITAEKQIKEQQYKEIERKNYLEERVHQIATAMEEMSMTVNEVAGNTGRASDSASQVADNAHEGQKVVNQAVHEMQKVPRLSGRRQSSSGIWGQHRKKSASLSTSSTKSPTRQTCWP